MSRFHTIFYASSRFEMEALTMLYLFNVLALYVMMILLAAVVL